MYRVVGDILAKKKIAKNQGAPDIRCPPISGKTLLDSTNTLKNNTTVSLLNEWDSNWHWLSAKHVGCHSVYISTTFGKFKIRHQELRQKEIKERE